MMQDEIWERDLNTARLVVRLNTQELDTGKLKSSPIPMLFILVWEWDWELVYG